MQNTIVLTALALVAACGGGGGNNTGNHDPDLAGGGGNKGDMAAPAGEPAGLAGITAAHNQVRANAMPTPQPALPALTWSTSLGDYAQTYAAKCVYKHSGGPHGENIYASAGSTPTGQSVVDAWASEAANYTYSSNACNGVCGHYTQIVWRDTTQLGCGIANCSTGSPFKGFSDWTFVVCDYDPPGNSGGKPY